MTRKSTADAVIVAAGSSSRMGGQDKLSAEILGRSLLRWSVEALAASSRVDRVVVVAAADRVAGLARDPWAATLGVQVVAGGARRQDSVAAGVAATSGELVLVHDAARPFVSASLIARVVDATDRHGAAIPVVPVVDALKSLEGDRISGTLERGGLARAQTPQGARRDRLADAAAAHAGGAATFADEAELLARAGIEVHVVPGDAANLKVTLPEDLALARRMAGDVPGARAAMGSDMHPFGPESGLCLGGLLLEGVPRLHGHSDGDVVLHAVCDALLAAAGQGDLGRHFPAGDAATRGVDSRSLLAEVVRRAAEAGWRTQSADVTIVGARPRLGGQRLDAMAGMMAGLLGVAAERVSVKASSGNLAGDEGAGRAISATCLLSAVPA